MAGLPDCSDFGMMIRLKTNNISGVVLAGGDNRRFGGIIKANTIIGGEKIITRITDIIGHIFDEIIIVTNTPEEFEQYSGYIITGDYFQKVGPLAGIHAAMKASTKEAVFIFAGDMPFLNNSLIINQIEFFYSIQTEVVLPEVNNMIEPLHGIYRNTLSDRLEAYLYSQNKHAVRDFLGKVDVSFLMMKGSDEVKKAFTNINTLSEAEKAKRDFEI